MMCNLVEKNQIFRFSKLSACRTGQLSECYLKVSQRCKGHELHMKRDQNENNIRFCVCVCNEDKKLA